MLARNYDASCQLLSRRAAQQNVSLFDHLVSAGDNCWIYLYAKPLRELGIDREKQLGRTLYRQFRRRASLNMRST